MLPKLSPPQDPDYRVWLSPSFWRIFLEGLWIMAPLLALLGVAWAIRNDIPRRLYRRWRESRTIERAGAPLEARSPVPSEPVPVCPRCGVKMVRRVATQGAHKGEPFYGCANYPKCRGLLKG